MTKLQKLAQELEQKNQEFKLVKYFVPDVNKEIDFLLILCKYKGEYEIDEYIYGLDGTEEEMEQLEFWVQEMGGANKLAKSIGMVDTQWTF